MVKTLIKAGKTLTGAKLVKAADNLKLTNPLLYKGVKITTLDRCRDYFPIAGADGEVHGGPPVRRLGVPSSTGVADAEGQTLLVH